MRHLTIGAAVLAGALLLAGCNSAGEKTDRPDVVRVFEVDGCTGYRFQGDMYNVYFVKCGDTVRTSTRVTNGKNSTRAVDVDTVNFRNATVIP